jgi:hypothetical protein
VAEPPVNVTASAPEFAGNPRASQEHALVSLILFVLYLFLSTYLSFLYNKVEKI